jgi:SAM-dependent methyltransferase
MFSIDFLNQIRAAEIDVILGHFPLGARILEIGAGTGRQALEISARGFSVEAIEIPDSNYRGSRLFPITNYDGRRIPFPDESFDLVFSSNVLEHVRDLPVLHTEIRRVMRPGATCVHVLPTHAWRFWTTLTAFPAAIQKVIALAVPVAGNPLSGHAPSTLGRLGALALRFGTGLGYLLSPFVQGRHGERGNIATELWLFRPGVWRKNFRRNGFELVGDEPMGLHYTGHFVFGAGWCLAKRARLAKRLGSACHLFTLRRKSDADAEG